MKNWQRKVLVVFAGLCCILVISSGIFIGLNFDHVQKLVRVVYAIEHDFLYDIDRDRLTDGAIKGMIEALDDTYAAYIDEEQIGAFQQSVSGDVYGIGVYVDQDADGNMVIVAPIEEGPAEAAGILAGDILLAVDGVSVQGQELETVVAKMRDGSATTVEIKILRNGEEYSFELKRYLIGTVKTVFGELLEQAPNVAYLRISRFSAQTAQEMVDAINQLRKEGDIEGVILDLRNNGGGDVNSAVDIARLFVPSGPILHVVYKDERRTTYSATTAQITVPLAVLVNENSASASEILSGALKDSGSGTLIGTRTFGKGLVQGVYFLNDHTAIKLTQAKYLTPSQNDIHGIGISPDIQVVLPEGAELNSAQDTQLQKAIEVVQR